MRLLFWLPDVWKLIFKARMRSFYSAFRQASYGDKNNDAVLFI